MHDPAVLDPVVSLIVYGGLLFVAVAVVGAAYLALKYGPRLARKGGLLGALFVDPPKQRQPPRSPNQRSA